MISLRVSGDVETFQLGFAELDALPGSYACVGCYRLSVRFGRCRAYQLDYGNASGERTAAVVLRDNQSNHLSNYDGRDGSSPRLRRGRQYKFDISASALPALNSRGTPPSHYYTRAERVVLVKYFSVSGESISVGGLPVLACLSPSNERW
jgi:hypothetical protein